MNWKNLNNMFDFSFFLFFLNYLKDRFIDIFTNDIKIYWLVFKYFFIFLNIFLLFLIIFFLKKVNNFIPKFNLIKLKPKLFFIKKFKKVKIISPKILSEYWQDIINDLLYKNKKLVNKKLALKKIDNLLFILLERNGIEGKDLNEKINKIDLEFYPELSKIIYFKNNILNDVKNFNENNFKELINLVEAFLKKLNLLE